MVLIEDFYQIREAPSKAVSRSWKLVHISVFAFTSTASFCATFCFRTALSQFLYNCILDPKIIFSSEYLTRPGVLSNTTRIHEIDLIFTVWGSTINCSFMQLTPLVSFISAVVWGSFFIIIRKGGAGYKNDVISAPWKIVYPCFFYSIVMSVIMLVASIGLSSSFREFCKQFAVELGEEECIDINYYTLQFEEEIGHFYIYIQLSIVSFYFSFVGWILQLILLLLRVCCIIDFEIESVHVTEISDLLMQDEKQESVIYPLSDTGSLEFFEKIEDIKSDITSFQESEDQQSVNNKMP